MRAAAVSFGWMAEHSFCLYSGRDNCLTVKGVSFFGPSDEYIVSGSDCGHLFVWSKVDGCLRRMAQGDNDYLNCVEPHPTLPLTMATSGALCVLRFPGQLQTYPALFQNNIGSDLL
jgi:hypothetical protein